MKNIFDSQEAIAQKIVNKYKKEIVGNVLKVLGSLDIVGNPVGLCTDVATGVIDLVRMPVKGFCKGPLQGGKGIFQGIGSFAKNIVKGPFNSFSKFTGSLASGFSSLSIVRILKILKVV